MKPKHFLFGIAVAVVGGWVLSLVMSGILLGYTSASSDLQPPSVVMEASSMMHPDDEVGFGRIGTIDPGDVITIHSAPSDDISTLVEQGAENFGLPGDVILFYPRNDRSFSPILHRAVAYVEVLGTGAEMTYRVRWDVGEPCEGGATKESRWCVYDAAGVLIPSVPVSRLGSTPQNPLPYQPEHSGFLTKGDNPFTNRNIDQISGLSLPVTPEMIEGVAVSETPWVGLGKLKDSDRPNERNPPATWTKVGNAYAPNDLWTMYRVVTFAPYVIAAAAGIALVFVAARQERTVRAP